MPCVLGMKVGVLKNNIGSVLFESMWEGTLGVVVKQSDGNGDEV